MIRIPRQSEVAAENTTVSRNTGIGISMACLLLFFCSPAAYSESFSLEISKSAQLLRVKQGEKTVKDFPVAFGRGGTGTKRRRGDSKTPIGQYRIAGFKEDSKFHYFMQLSYPNLIDAWHGYKSQLISGGEFKRIAAAFRENKLPPQGTSLGGHIGLHGIGEVTREKLDIHSTHNWTDGCIAMKNNQIDELRDYVSIGTLIVITD